MKSRITIEVDFENGNQPTIQIVSKSSDDVRDRLIQSFYQKLGGCSSWCKIQFIQDVMDEDPERAFKRIYITPITEQELKKEADVMLEQYRLNEEWLKTHKP
jgi:hypothetical protein